MSYNYKCKCIECGAEMTSREFDRHDCRMIPKAVKGESFADYKRRCDEYRGVVRILQEEK